MSEGFEGGDDSGTDSGLDVSADSDISASESADISIEPASMEGLDDTTPPIPEQELAELQNEAAALEIEPLDESEQPEFYTLQPTDHQPEIENSGSVGLGTRILAGAMAPFVALDPMAADIQNINGNKVPDNDVPAIYAEIPNPVKTPEQMLTELSDSTGLTWTIAGQKNG